MKILHTADIHLKEYGDERWKALEELIKIGKEEKIEVFVICGDLFDKGINAESLRPHIRDLFSNNGFKIALIAGNHDWDCYKAGFYFGEDTAIIADRGDCLQFEDVSIWGMPFEPMQGEEVVSRLQSLASSFSSHKKNILLYHGELLDTFFSRSDLGDEGEQRYMPVKLSYFKNLNLDYVLAGHFHSNFDVHSLEGGGHFVYPGSPVSITRRETGRRKINIFETGEPPREYLLETPHFEEVVIELDPFEPENPVDVVRRHFQGLHPNAKAVLTVKGFFNGAAIGASEKDLVRQIEQVVADRCVDKRYEFRDIGVILEDDLFKNFMRKLEDIDAEREKKKQMCNMAIQAMMQAVP